MYSHKPFKTHLSFDTETMTDEVKEMFMKYQPSVFQAMNTTEALRQQMGVPVYGLRRTFENGAVDIHTYDSDAVRVVRVNILTKALQKTYPSGKTFLYSGLVGAPIDASDLYQPRTGFVPAMCMANARSGITPSEANIAYPMERGLSNVPAYLFDWDAPADPLMDGFPEPTRRGSAVWVQRRVRPATFYSGLMAVAVQAGLGIGQGSYLTKGEEYWGLSYKIENEPEWFTFYKSTRVVSADLWLGGGCAGPGFFMDFDYRWEICHGLIKDPDGVLWTVEIAKSGVRAWKTVIIPESNTQPFYDRAKGNQDIATVALLDQLGAIPLGARYPLDGSPIYSLLSEKDMAVVYDRWTAHHKAHGWAFSPKDPVAVHALLRIENDQSISFSRWSIRLSFDKSGVPSAAITQEEQVLNVRGNVFEGPSHTGFSGSSTGSITEATFGGCPEDYPRDLAHSAFVQYLPWFKRSRGHAIGKAMYFYGGTCLTPATDTHEVSAFTAEGTPLGCNSHDVPLYVFFSGDGELIQVRHFDESGVYGAHGPVASSRGYIYPYLSDAEVLGGENPSKARYDYDYLPQFKEFLAGQMYNVWLGDEYLVYGPRWRYKGPLRYGAYVVTTNIDQSPLNVFSDKSPRFGFKTEYFDNAWAVVPEGCREAFYFGYLHTIQMSNVSPTGLIPWYYDGGWERYTAPAWIGDGVQICYWWPADERVVCACPWLNTFLPSHFQTRRAPYDMSNSRTTQMPGALFSPDTLPLTPPSGKRWSVPVAVYAIGERRRPNDYNIIREIVRELPTTSGALRDPCAGVTYRGAEYPNGVPRAGNISYSAVFFVCRGSNERSPVSVNAVPQYDEGSFLSLHHRDRSTSRAQLSLTLAHWLCPVPIPRVMLPDIEQSSPGEHVADETAETIEYTLVRSVYNMPCAYSVFGSSRSGGNLGSVVCLGSYVDVGQYPIFFERITVAKFSDRNWYIDAAKGHTYRFAYNDPTGNTIKVTPVSNAGVMPPAYILRCRPDTNLIDQRHCEVTAFTLSGSWGEDNKPKDARLRPGVYYIGYV